ncbi:MAG: bifunctional hydroxymethylpyrimidine kinase/phosphomethylpyrimidine kinase [Treponemataceae bacterium]|nr:bifunctional hydroxymethylpyrimidine kinase/phosphomethylpyrimidine kinase [Treponemataceae bacterium]
MNTALTIAGSDSSGGAGIQADIKTMLANGVYGMSAITALTAQNTTGVSSVLEVPPEFLAEQIRMVVTDIFPDSVKTGMVSSAALVSVIAEGVRTYNLKNLVVDPVMVSTSGARLISDEAAAAMQSELFPLASVVTPNVPEAEAISGMRILSAGDMEEAARRIASKYGCAVLCKGGHAMNDADDYLFDGTDGQWFHGQRIDNPNTHGTGCTLSSAIAAHLAKGCALSEAVEKAKAYLSGALSAMLDLGAGRGPMDHGFGVLYE